MNVNFKLLGTFLAVAENESFRGAADELNRSLPAVSMQIKQLEERLGVALFHRTTRRVELTREGEELMLSARKALAELDTGLANISVLHANNLRNVSSYEFMQVNTLVAMAEAGLGVALLPHVAIPRKTVLNAVRIISPTLGRTIAIVTIRGHSLSPAAARLVRLCRELIAPEPLQTHVTR